MTVTRVLLAALVGAVAALPAADGWAASARFEQDCAALTKAPHRLTGTPEYASAAAHVERRLKEIGADKIIVQSFPVAQTRVKRCELHVAGADTPLLLLPMRPNGIIPPVTPPEGITGPLVHAGAARLQDFEKQSVRGAIVVVDYNAGAGWLRAFRQGAKAVVFVGTGTADARHPHYVRACANLPRFYYPGRRQDFPAGKTATIHSEVVWEGAVGRNVFAFLRGTEPEFAQEKDELIVLAAYLDSYGEVPRLSAGARGAANCAGLLKLAEHFKNRRPRRHLLVAFFDGQARAHAGSSAFYRALEDKESKVKVETRQKSLVKEQGFFKEMRALLARPDPLGEPAAETRPMALPAAALLLAVAAGGFLIWSLLPPGADGADEAPVAKTATATQRRRTKGVPLIIGSAAAFAFCLVLAYLAFPESGGPEQPGAGARRQLLSRLRDCAAAHTHLIGDRMYRLRDEAQALRKRSHQGAAKREAEERISEIARLVKEDWQPQKDGWNALRRALGREETEGLAPDVQGKLDLILDEVRRNVQLRVAELEEEEQALRSDADLKQLIGDHWIVLHASLLLGDVTPRWGLLIGGDSCLHSNKDNPGRYGKVQGVFLRAYEGMAGRGAAAHFEAASANQEISKTRALWAAPHLIHGGEIAGQFGIYNLALGTCQERLAREGTPDDVLSRLGLGRIESQADGIAQLLSEVASDPGLSLKRSIVPDRQYEVAGFANRKPRGPMVMGVLPGSSTPNTPMPGAVVQFRVRASGPLSFTRQKPYAFEDFQILRTNRNGVYGLGPVPEQDRWSWSRRSGIAAVFDERGAVTSISDLNSLRSIRSRLNVFRCRPGVVVLPPQLDARRLPVNEVQVFSARADAVLDKKKSFVETADGVVAWYSDLREKGVKLFGLRQMVALNSGPELLNPGDEGADPQGTGFSMEGAWEPMSAAPRAAADLWRLNESRLAILREKEILDSSLEELHGRAEDLLTAARGAPSSLQRESLAASSYWASQPAYSKTRGMLDDLVVAVLILLGLSVPFAFALERVVIGATTIYRQVTWFATFFALTFVALYLSHPAFAIANTPIIIFLGFAIVVMSSLVIWIIMRKFEVELKTLQGMAATVHAADVSRVNTFLAAMQMGISTMRRRRLRTGLTAVTIILLTFTILCFASFGTRVGIVSLFFKSSPPYTGAWVHQVNWEPLTPGLFDVVRGRWGKDAQVCRRLWVCPKTADSPGLLLTRHDGTEPVTIDGVLGIEPEEIAQRPGLARLLGRDLGSDDRAAPGVLVTRAVAERLGVRPGDTVVLRGHSLRVGRVLDPSQLAAAKDMDGSNLLPVDFTQVSSAQAVTPKGEAMLAQRNWASLPPDSVVIVSADKAEALGADLYAITLYTRGSAQASQVAEDLARVVSFPVAATRANGVYLHLLGTILAASGVRDLFFPILLGGLVIFGTMLGSVADREKEIYTFSALGLAPRHVATLFLAESMVYSLIGGMGGYLLAQGTMKVLTFLVDQGLVGRVPEMNMSSTNTIVTILIVMATVLVSAIYPAVKASKSANPGLMRTWRVPEPKGDLLDLVFPFTVSEYDITGVVSFLKEHFDSHTDTGLGRFMARDTRLMKDAEGALGLDALLTLAPFDLGVSESFALRSKPSEIPGIDEVHIRLERRSGQPKDWRRLNKVFLDDLRRQFLIWRSISHTAMETYRDRTLTALGEAAAPPPEDT